MSGHGEAEGRGRRRVKGAGAAPDEAALREAALRHLARFESAQAGLARVLARRVERWRSAAAAAPGADGEAIAGRAAEAAAAARRVLAALAASGAVDDRRFAAGRARQDARGGKSARMSAARLLAAGVDPDLSREAAARDDAAELDAALLHARRRRLGPFGPPDADRRRALASFARAGFSADTARAVLALDPDEAVERVETVRREG